MTQDEALASAALQSLGSTGFEVRNWRRRPFRAPHHTASGVDRIDIQIEVPAVAPEDLSRVGSGDSSSVIRVRVEQARARMIVRQEKENARLTTREIEKYCAPDEKGATLLKQAISRLGLSARGYHRILKVARTIADLADVEGVSDAQVAEAIQYRRFDRQ